MNSARLSCCQVYTKEAHCCKWEPGATGLWCTCLNKHAYASVCFIGIHQRGSLLQVGVISNRVPPHNSTNSARPIRYLVYTKEAHCCKWEPGAIRQCPTCPHKTHIFMSASGCFMGIHQRGQLLQVGVLRKPVYATHAHTSVLLCFFGFFFLMF